MKKRETYTIDEDIIVRLNKYAKRTDENKSAIVNSLLEDFLDEVEGQEMEITQKELNNFEYLNDMLTELKELYLNGESKIKDIYELSSKIKKFLQENIEYNSNYINIIKNTEGGENLLPKIYDVLTFDMEDRFRDMFYDMDEVLYSVNRKVFFNDLAWVDPNLNLPEYCYYQVSSNENLETPHMIVKLIKGRLGYVPTNLTGDYEELNKELGVTKAQVQAMSRGAVFGWDNEDIDPKKWEHLND